MKLLGFEFTLQRARAKQATVPGTADTPENARKFRRARDDKRDLPAFQHDRALSVATRLLREDGIACRMAGWLEEWCVGEGASVSSNLKDEKAREEHEEFLYELWRAPECDWEKVAPLIAKTLRPLGEILFALYPPRVRPGVTVFANLDPADIQCVVTNPNNCLQTVGVLMKGAMGQVPVFLPHHEWVRWAEEHAELAKKSGIPAFPPEGSPIEFSIGRDRTKAKVGPLCAYFGANKTLGSSRGVSMLYPIADLLDAFDQSVWQQMEGVAVRNTLGAVVTSEGGTPGTAQKVVDTLQAHVGKGGVYVAGPKGTEIKTVGGGLGSADFDIHHGTLCKRLSATTNFPITWFGMGGETGNNATTEIAGPALKMLRLAQAEARGVIRELLLYAVRAGAPEGKAEEWEDFKIELPEIGGRDMVRDSAAVSTLMVAIDSGDESQAWTRAKAGEMKRAVATQFMGVEFEPEDYPDESEIEAAEALAEEERRKMLGADPADDGQNDGEPEDEKAKRDADDLANARKNGKAARVRQSRRRPVGAGA